MAKTEFVTEDGFAITGETGLYEPFSWSGPQTPYEIIWVKIQKPDGEFVVFDCDRYGEPDHNFYCGANLLGAMKHALEIVNVIRDFGERALPYWEHGDLNYYMTLVQADELDY